MKSHGLIAVAALTVLMLSVGCVRDTYQYSARQEMPRMIYVQGELGDVMTQKNQLAGKRVFVEVTMQDGKVETGKLIRLNELELVMSPEYYYESVGDSVRKVETEKAIPKEDIFILKVF